MAEPVPGWERLAGANGGTVAALATVSGAGDTRLVFAATPAGVYQSADGGRTWRVAGAGSTVPFGEALAPSPGFARNRTLFVGAADGVYRSRDAGETWHKVLTDCRALSLTSAMAADGRELVLVGTETVGILPSADVGRCESRSAGSDRPPPGDVTLF